MSSTGGGGGRPPPSSSPLPTVGGPGTSTAPSPGGGQGGRGQQHQQQAGGIGGGLGDAPTTAAALAASAGRVGAGTPGSGGVGAAADASSSSASGPAAASPSQSSKSSAGTSTAGSTSNPTPSASAQQQQRGGGQRQGGGGGGGGGGRPAQQQPDDPADEAVLAYLKKRGLGAAALELTRLLDDEKKQREGSNKRSKRDDGEGGATTAKDGGADDEHAKKKTTSATATTASGGGGGEDDDNRRSTFEERFRRDEESRKIEETRAGERHRTYLSRSTGGGLGYDLDAASTLPTWGSTNLRSLSLRTPSAAAGDGGDGEDDEVGEEFAGVKVGDVKSDLSEHGRREARLYTRSFTALMGWVLSLPDDPDGGSGRGIDLRGKAKEKKDAAGGDGGEEEEDNPLLTLGEGVREVLRSANVDRRPAPAAAAGGGSSRRKVVHVIPPLPPSAKPELVAVCFPLLVHAYCELLEYGMQEDAAALLAAWRGLFEPLYAEEMRDLDKCRTTDQIVELNSQVIAHKEAHSTRRHAEARLEKFRSQMKEQERRQYERKIREAESREATHARQLRALPFLHRVRTFRLQLSVSAYTYSLLSAFLSRERLIPMSVLLLSKCHLNVENRDPLPYTPACILEGTDVATVDDATTPTDHDSSSGGDEPKKKKKITNLPPPAPGPREGGVRWAAPVHPDSRAAEQAVEPPTAGDRHRLPFPKFLDGGRRADGDDEDDAVSFNRSLLMHGFRRLEALEAKREYEEGTRGDPYRQSSSSSSPSSLRDMFCDPLAPSVMLATCCSSSSSSSTATTTTTSTSSFSQLDEPGIGITCARLSPGDGRKLAAGCEDAAIRVWSLQRGGSSSSRHSNGTGGGEHSGKGTVDTSSARGSNPRADDVSEAQMVLLGHKNGWPVFDVDWSRDGRCLISCGGDGSVRLWDTGAVGPYGKLTTVVSKKEKASKSSSSAKSVSSTGNSSPKKGGVGNSSPTKGGAGNSSPTKGGAGNSSPTKGGTSADKATRTTSEQSTFPSTSVRGLKEEPRVEVGGAALSVYRGHTSGTPVWSCRFAPSGYYFASAGGDTTARIWTTDRPSPVRILAGHMSSVNAVVWHPNCNYVLTGSDDKTCRMWDIQTGRCVRMLSGCFGWVGALAVCPSGRYAAAADGAGVIGIWDLGSGRRVNELRGHRGSVHTLAYSVCGSTLASGGDDCSVKIWDVRGAAFNPAVPEYAAANDVNGNFVGGVAAPRQSSMRPGLREPVNTFQTRRTILLDMQFTKRNLLMCAGKYAANVG